MSKTILHIDMDAFYAAVEARDNPDYAGKPLIVGAFPHERGVVSTCSYEAREFGVRSAMNIKEAYRRCPHGIYVHPNMDKYKNASDRIHEIWNQYTNVIEYISLDEGYLDITGSTHLFGSPREIALAIKTQTVEKTGLTCSVGIGYSMATAKLASEEKKPNGLFEIPDAEFYKNLVTERSLRIIYGIGAKTAEKLENIGIRKVQDILPNRQRIIYLLGKHGSQIIELADGRDTRKVTPYYESEAKSIGREHTFQRDITDFGLLRDKLRLLAAELSLKVRGQGIYCHTVTLKITYADMHGITRSRTGESINRAEDIYRIAAELLAGIEREAVRLVGISLSGFSQNENRQLSLDDLAEIPHNNKKKKLDEQLMTLQKKYGASIVKTGSEFVSENRMKEEKE